MYGAGNPQMAALGALGALGGSLREMAMAPVRRWGQTGFMHRVIAAGAGAGLAYYFHKKGMADVGVVAVGLGGAYAASALMHYPQVMQNGGAALPGGQPSAGALPAGQVNNMTAQAQAMMNGNAAAAGGATAGGSLAPAGSDPVQNQQPMVGSMVGSSGQTPSANSTPMAGGGSSPWAALG